MNRLARGLLLLALLGHVSRAEDYVALPDALIPGVVEISQDTWEEVLATRGDRNMLVEFYGPWCGHCKALVPEYSHLAELVAADAELSARFILAKVNMDIEYDLGDAFEVSKVPTFKYLPGGLDATNANAETYTGPRTAVSILEFLQSKLAAAEKMEL